MLSNTQKIEFRYSPTRDLLREYTTRKNDSEWSDQAACMRTLFRPVAVLNRLSRTLYSDAENVSESLQVAKLPSLVFLRRG